MINEFRLGGFRSFLPKLEKSSQMVTKHPDVFYRLENDGGTLVGVVRSQTNDNLIYACYLRSDGSYGCQTQNLHSCGGLRGSICKHILTVIVSSSQNEVIMNRLVRWIKNSLDQRPSNDKDLSFYIFEQYNERGIIIANFDRSIINFRGLNHVDNFPVPSTIKIIEAPLIQGEVSIKADGNLKNISTTIISVGTGEKIELAMAVESGWSNCKGCNQWLSPDEQDAFKEGTDCPSSMLGLAKAHVIRYE